MTTETEWGPWTKHHGGPCPCPDAKAGEVEVEFSNGQRDCFNSADEWSIGSHDWWKWQSPDNQDNIVAYRLRIPATDWKGIAEGLAKALAQITEEQCDYMRINSLGDPETQHTVMASRTALEAARRAGRDV